MRGEERREQLGEYEKPSDSQEKLRELSLYLSELKDRRAAEKNRLQGSGCEDIKSFVTKSIEDLNKLVESVEKTLAKIVEKEKELWDKVELLCKYKGVGQTSAIKLVSLAPELGTLSRREVASLAGLAPRANDSGKKKGRRRTCGGGQILKKTMFTIALFRLKYEGKIKDYYESPQARGKKKIVALVVCMRKIIAKLNAILRDGKII